MSDIFFISDLHFGHKHIMSFVNQNGRTLRTGDDYMENMHIIIQKWNDVVTKRDTVYVLGDLCMDVKCFDYLFELKGRLKLVRGNHDDILTTRELLSRFDTVEGSMRLKEFWLTHVPIHPQELRGKRNIHGHVHMNSIRDYHGEYDKNYINVCCEAINETPVSLSQIRSGDYCQNRKC